MQEAELKIQDAGSTIGDLKDGSGNARDIPDDGNCRGQCGYTPWCKDCKTPETTQKK
jgi:hypothetical protein